MNDEVLERVAEIRRSSDVSVVDAMHLELARQVEAIFVTAERRGKPLHLQLPDYEIYSLEELME